jgi:hypothetical protein
MINAAKIGKEASWRTILMNSQTEMEKMEQTTAILPNLLPGRWTAKKLDE